MPDLQQETVDLLARLVRMNTVNPPGNERPLQELLADRLRDASFDVSLVGRTEQRPNLVHCDELINEGGGAVLPYGDERLHPVCVAEKGVFRFTVTAEGVAGHA